MNIDGSLLINDQSIKALEDAFQHPSISIKLLDEAYKHISVRLMKLDKYKRYPHAYGSCIEKLSRIIPRNSVTQSSYFSLNNNFSIYSRVDLARLIAIDESINGQGIETAIYFDMDISPMLITTQASTVMSDKMLFLQIQCKDKTQWDSENGVIGTSKSKSNCFLECLLTALELTNMNAQNGNKSSLEAYKEIRELEQKTNNEEKCYVRIASSKERIQDLDAEVQNTSTSSLSSTAQEAAQLAQEPTDNLCIIPANVASKLKTAAQTSAYTICQDEELSLLVKDEKKLLLFKHGANKEQIEMSDLLNECQLSAVLLGIDFNHALMFTMDNQITALIVFIEFARKMGHPLSDAEINSALKFRNDDQIDALSIYFSNNASDTTPGSKKSKHSERFFKSHRTDIQSLLPVEARVIKGLTA